jgi:hypothetical protein
LVVEIVQRFDRRDGIEACGMQPRFGTTLIEQVLLARKREIPGRLTRLLRLRVLDNMNEQYWFLLLESALRGKKSIYLSELMDDERVYALLTDAGFRERTIRGWRWVPNHESLESPLVQEHLCYEFDSSFEYSVMGALHTTRVMISKAGFQHKDKIVAWVGSRLCYYFKKGGRFRMSDAWEEIRSIMTLLSDHELRLLLINCGENSTSEEVSRGSVSGELAYFIERSRKPNVLKEAMKLLMERCEECLGKVEGIESSATSSMWFDRLAKAFSEDPEFYSNVREHGGLFKFETGGFPPKK